MDQGWGLIASPLFQKGHEMEEEKLTIDSWKVDDALRTLTKAEEIKQDKELMDLVTKKAATQKKVLDDLASRANTLYSKMEDK